MAQITETTVRATVTLSVDDDGTGHALVRGRSFDQAGGIVRTFGPTDIFDQLAATRRTAIVNLVGDVATRLRTAWDIAEAPPPAPPANPDVLVPPPPEP